MKLRYLGTAAAEGIPAIFCGCETCIKSAASGGRNVRTRSQAVVDETLLIDFPADTYLHCLWYGLDLHRIRHCIITHDHEDHLYERELFNLEYVDTMAEPFRFYGGLAAVRRLKSWHYDKLHADGRVQIDAVAPFIPFIAAGYTITPLPADHAPISDPLLYCIEKGGRTLLYANDTGWFPAATLDWLYARSAPIDCISFDCTAGLLTGWRTGHLSFDIVRELTDLLCKKGVVASHTKLILNHFSHNGQATYDEMQTVAEKYGFLVSYDNFSVTV